MRRRILEAVRRVRGYDSHQGEDLNLGNELVLEMHDTVIDFSSERWCGWRSSLCKTFAAWLP
jgi:hypothetical protein